ncbi:methyltransferase domain-containing protein [Candidatus Kaiserbacteria bacterium]|nr:methyltransferase domain-containing protein [Candidatus Kaiserbacteria bacterium]
MRTRLNLGCGKDYLKEWDNWDVSRDVRADAYLDVGKDTFPAPDATYEEIYCAGILEQILENASLVHALNECHRVLRPGGTLTIVVPNARYPIAFRDPFDCRQFIPETFKYLTHGDRLYEKFGSVYGFKPWILRSLSPHVRKGLFSFRGIMTVVLEKPR